MVVSYVVQNKQVILRCNKEQDVLCECKIGVLAKGRKLHPLFVQSWIYLRHQGLDITTGSHWIVLLMWTKCLREVLWKKQWMWVMAVDSLLLMDLGRKRPDWTEWGCYCSIPWNRESNWCWLCGRIFLRLSDPYRKASASCKFWRTTGVSSSTKNILKVSKGL